MRAQRSLEGISGLNDDESIGVNIIRRSLEQPLKLIVENAGSEGAVVLNEVKQQADDYGYDADIGEFGPMLERGIVDPVKSYPLRPAKRRQRSRYGADHRVHDYRNPGGQGRRAGYAADGLLAARRD